MEPLPPDVPMPKCVSSLASLRARWRGDGNALEDTKTYNGTNLGGVSFTAGPHGMAFVFDGIDDAISADPTDQLWPQGSFTVEAWLKTTVKPTTYATLFEKYDCGGADKCGGADWGLFVLPSGFPQFGLRVGGGNSASVTGATTPVTDGNWHHLVGVRDTTAMAERLYVDGALAVSMPLADSFSGPMTDDGVPDPVTIGSRRTSGSNAVTADFVGAIADAGYYIEALSAEKIAEIYAAPQGFCK